ncbi:hypothetical protein A2774_00230 [Candidatus Roizmanbacteria bacterium RIFCSPHIGHO2_01_FULL_39_12c]|uniref:FAD-binding FR-type domain-containing protein n=1 Tax=Candidatus Roizmanbacteria bacterium RIFCSPHIGHO2_01_FULL_39_12c TaxID=1802031 RepID=A0A1F7GCI5_9BACT|nr:MAG: hypothetical protein A2774_00230 [Candidatus Roizmanbacteria bacterium RIFCSPHIGHO2_01_FULL_39_12c]
MAQLAQKYDLAFLKKNQVAEETFSFFFQRPEGLDFQAGQFLRLTLNLPQPSERGSNRFFSIASSPSEKGILMITVKTSSQVYKKTLLSLKTNDKVRIALPYGIFTLKTGELSPYIFLAGGIGITPFRSMIRYSADQNLDRPIALFSAFSTVDEIVFQAEMQTLAKDRRWFKFIQTVSRPQNSSTPWYGNVGRIDANLISKNAHSLASSIYYIAGPPTMVDSMIAIVKSLGVEESRIRREKFTGYE